MRGDGRRDCAHTATHAYIATQSALTFRRAAGVTLSHSLQSYILTYSAHFVIIWLISACGGGVGCTLSLVGCRERGGGAGSGRGAASRDQPQPGPQLAVFTRARRLASHRAACSRRACIADGSVQPTPPLIYYSTL